MHRAHQRDAVHSQKFYFRKNLFSPAPGHGCSPLPSAGHALNGLPTHINGRTNGDDLQSSICSSHTTSPRSHSPTCEKKEFGPVEDEYDEFTINEIINGDGKEFPGLLGVVRKYMDTLDVKPSTREQLDKSLELVRRRADGELCSALASSFR